MPTLDAYAYKLDLPKMTEHQMRHLIAFLQTECEKVDIYECGLPTYDAGFMAACKEALVQR